MNIVDSAVHAEKLMVIVTSLIPSLAAIRSSVSRGGVKRRGRVFVASRGRLAINLLN